MKLPGIALALLAAALPACTCSPSETPAPAAAFVETEQPAQAQAAAEPVPAGSGTRRFLVQRAENNKKRPLIERIENIRPMLTDGGSPAPAKLNCGPTSAKAKVTDAASR